MNKQRKVLITITYNEMGIIIDTKAEEVAQPNLQPTCNQLATDCISRHAVSAWLDNIGHPEFADVVMDENRFPPAQPEREKGEWKEIEVIADAYDISGVKTWASKMKCDKCGFITIAVEGHFSQYNFCPKCGSDMRGKQDGNQ